MYLNVIDAANCFKMYLNVIDAVPSMRTVEKEKEDCGEGEGGLRRRKRRRRRTEEKGRRTEEDEDWGGVG